MTGAAQWAQSQAMSSSANSTMTRTKRLMTTPDGAKGIDALAKFGVVYLASPYTRFPRGLEMAFIEVCRIAAKMVKAGVKVYSPIAHTHPIATHGSICKTDHSLWLPFDFALMRKADALCVAKMEGWEHSFGVAEEIQMFRADQKPIFYLDPETMTIG